MCELEITPPIGSSLPGYFEDRKSTGIRDPLYAKALVIESGATVAAFISLDAITVTRPVVNAIRQRVSEWTGIPGEHVMVTVTHIHTGPPVMTTTFYKSDESYLSWLAMKAADAVIMAYRNRVEARIGVGAGYEADISFNRRFRMKDGTVRTNPGLRNPEIDHVLGPIDPQVVVVRIDDVKGQPIGVVSNFACHTDVVGGTDYSADFPGELSRTLKHAYGEHVVSLFLLGACGNLNQIDFISGLEKEYQPSYLYQKMGRVLAGEVIKTREKIRPSDRCEVEVRKVLFPVGCRKPTEKEVASAQKILQTESSESVEYNFALELVEAGASKADTVEFEVQVFRLGDLAVVGLPGEPFVEFGLAIKERSPFRYTAISELSNGSAIAYICTREAYQQGGYEPRITSNSNVAEDAGELLVEHSLELLNQLHTVRPQEKS
jgi:hypothetical protein